MSVQHSLTVTEDARRRVDSTVVVRRVELITPYTV